MSPWEILDASEEQQMNVIIMNTPKISQDSSKAHSLARVVLQNRQEIDPTPEQEGT